MIKSHEKKCQNYARATMISSNNMVKCRRNVNIEEMDTERSAGKNDAF